MKSPMKIDGVRLIRGHARQCDVASQVDDPLYLYTSLQALSVRGYGSGHWSWYGFRCGEMDCPAEIWLREDLLTKQAHEAMQKLTKGVK